MSNIPRYLYSMEHEQFYYNPECPGLMTFSPDFPAEGIKKVRIPVRIIRDGEVWPGHTLPRDIAENTRILF
jgi:hypothetical protein